MFTLEENALKLILFGGKGGVGKTTCALSTGLHLAGEGLKVLVISTDPAHSISDSLGQKIGDEITEVKGAKNLSALEINAQKAFSQFKVRYEGQIKKIFDTSTYLDHDDIDSLFTLPIPGIDEVMGFKTIVDLIDEAKFDKYIVDTAPTGHALRLLTLPELLDDWIKVLAKMRWKYRYMVERFSGEYNPDEGDDFLLEMKKTIKRIEGLLRDPKRCQFIAVTIPEDMAILETDRLLRELNEYGIKVRRLQINNVHPHAHVGMGGAELNHCDFCRERGKSQKTYLERIKTQFGDLSTTVIPLQPGEVKGVQLLHIFSGFLFNDGKER